MKYSTGSQSKPKPVQLKHLNYQTTEELSLWQTFCRGGQVVLRAAPQELRVLVLVNVVTAWGPAASLFCSKIIIDEVSRILGAGTVVESGWQILGQESLLLWGIGLTLGFNLLADALGILQTNAFVALWDRVEGSVKQQVLDKLAYFNDVALFEIPDLLNLVKLTEKGLPRLQRLSAIIVGTLSGLFRLVPSVLLSASIGIWILLLLLISSVPSIAIELHYRKRNWQTEKLYASQSREMNLYEQMIQGDTYAKEIRLFALQGVLIDHWKGLWQTIFDNMQVIRKAGRNHIAFWSTVSGIGTAIPYVYIVAGVLEGRYTLGDLALYTGIIIQLRQSLFFIIVNLGDIYDVLLAARPIFQLLDLEPLLVSGLVSDRPVDESSVAEPSVTNSPVTDFPVTNDFRGTNILHDPSSNQGRGIAVQNLSFTYPGSHKPTVDQVSLTIAPGEMVALVGENGAGKTTLAKLLCRLYDPQLGSIYWDGVDFREMDLQWLRSRITVVMQDYARFPTSLRNNVGWGRLQCSQPLEEEAVVQRALTEAGLGHLPETLEKGLDTPLGKQLEDGMDLSGGQWQRVSIARALMRIQQGELLVFDEPTAALDPKNEHEIYHIFKTIAQNRMTLVISHRLALAKLADRIVVMEHGQIIEEGNHDQLMAIEGVYHTMFTRQASSYQ